MAHWTILLNLLWVFYKRRQSALEKEGGEARKSNSTEKAGKSKVGEIQAAGDDSLDKGQDDCLSLMQRLLINLNQFKKVLINQNQLWIHEFVKTRYYLRKWDLRGIFHSSKISEKQCFTSSTMFNGRRQRCAIKKQKPKSAICTSLITCLLPIVQCMLDFSSTDIMHMNETMTVTRSYKMNVASVIKHSS